MRSICFCYSYNIVVDIDIMVSINSCGFFFGAIIKVNYVMGQAVVCNENCC